MGANLSVYVSRQSFVSVGNPVTERTLLSKTLDSPFRQKMFRGDLLGNALTRIADAFKKNPDTLLIIDLTDERGGFFEHPDGQIVTRGYEADMAKCFVHLTDPWEHVRFGTTRHMVSFLDAANSLQQGLKSAGAWKNTIVFDNRWASVDTEGNPTPPSYLLTAEAANEYFEEYTHLLRETGWRIIESPVRPIADADNIWGLAPFHYCGDYYQGNAENLVAIGSSLLATNSAPRANAN